MVRKQLKRIATPTRAAMAGTGATVIDMSANPYDLSPAVNHIVTTVKEALAADQKVILMLGEEHNTITHVRMAELVRQGLRRAGIENPVIAVENSYNLLERFLPVFFPSDLLSSFRTRAVQALLSLKTADLAYFSRLQSLLCAILNGLHAPVANLENFCVWRDNGLDVHLVDMAITDAGYLDCADPATKTFVDAYALSGIEDKTHVDAEGDEGMRLRNEWTALYLRAILADNHNYVVILQAGLSHLGGGKGYPYPDSLHSIFANAANDNIRAISVFPQNHGDTFENFLSREAQEAMDNPETIILRGQNGTQHRKNGYGSFEKEIGTLAHISGASCKPHIRSEADYHDLRGEFKRCLKEEIRAITKEFAPCNG